MAAIGAMMHQEIPTLHDTPNGPTTTMTADQLAKLYNRPASQVQRHLHRVLRTVNRPGADERRKARVWERFVEWLQAG